MPQYTSRLGDSESHLAKRFKSANGAFLSAPPAKEMISSLQVTMAGASGGPASLCSG